MIPELVAVSWVFCPSQIAGGWLVVTVIVFTVTVVVALAVQPLGSMMNTVYVVVAVGAALGPGQLLQLKPLVGVHE